MIRFAYTILYVRDVAASLAFYEQAFGLQKKFMTPERDYGELLSGETTLAFASRELGNSNLSAGYIPSEAGGKPFGFELAFTSDNVQESVDAALAAGGKLLEPMKTKPWGQDVAYVQDLDGFLLEICTPMAG